MTIGCRNEGVEVGSWKLEAGMKTWRLSAMWRRLQPADGDTPVAVALPCSAVSFESLRKRLALLPSARARRVSPSAGRSACATSAGIQPAGPAGKRVHGQDWPPHKMRRRKLKEAGSALIAVLWLSAALSAIAFAMSMTVRGETARTATSMDDLRSYYLASAGVEQGHQSSSSGPPPRAPRLSPTTRPSSTMTSPAGPLTWRSSPKPPNWTSITSRATSS